jgi:hypothetical protein
MVVLADLIPSPQELGLTALPIILVALGLAFVVSRLLPKKPPPGDGAK